MQHLYFLAEVPGPPGVPTITTVHNTSMSLKWTAPTDDGGCPADGYVLEYRAEGSGPWTSAADDLIPDTEYTVRRLKTDAAYEFRVAARNPAGTGKFSSATKPAQASSPVGECNSWLGALFSHFLFSYRLF